MKAAQNLCEKNDIDPEKLERCLKLATITPDYQSLFYSTLSHLKLVPSMHLHTIFLLLALGFCMECLQQRPILPQNNINVFY